MAYDPMAPMPRPASLNTLHRQLYQIFSDMRRVGFTPMSLDEAQYDFRPNAEVHEAEGTTTIRVELPGVNLDDITIEVTDNALEISGHKGMQSAIVDGDRYRTERSFGSFRRAFVLPFPIDADAVDAAFDKGVLTIEIPTPDETDAGTKTIAITS